MSSSSGNIVIMLKTPFIMNHLEHLLHETMSKWHGASTELSSAYSHHPFLSCLLLFSIWSGGGGCPFLRNLFSLKWLRLSKTRSLITSSFLVKTEILHLTLPPYSLPPTLRPGKNEAGRRLIFSLRFPWKSHLGPAVGDLKAGIITPVSWASCFFCIPTTPGFRKIWPDFQGLEVVLLSSWSNWRVVKWWKFPLRVLSWK